MPPVMERHGIEWEDKGTHDQHLSVLDYKKEQRAKEIAATGYGQGGESKTRWRARNGGSRNLAPAVKNMERLAAEFLRQTRRRSYRSRGRWKRARPTGRKRPSPCWAKIVKVLRSVYRAYLDLQIQI